MVKLVVIVILIGVAIRVATYPFGVHRRDSALAGSKWVLPPAPVHVRVHDLSIAGAYRDAGKLLQVQPTSEAIPKLPKRIALWCLCIGAASVFSLPLLAFGVVMQDNFALLFGIPGISLAITTWIVGRRLQRGFAQDTRLFKFTAIWTALHNFSLLVIAIVASAPSTDDGLGRRHTPFGSYDIRHSPFGSLDNALIALVAACIASSMLALAYQLWKVATEQAKYSRHSEISQARLYQARTNVAVSKHITESELPALAEPVTKIRVASFAPDVVEAPPQPTAEFEETEVAPLAGSAKQIR